jgi:PadR family transcriptional regulator PadR
MTRSRAPSQQTVAVLHALAADPAAWRYGYELGQQVGLKAGSLYPILIRLADRGLLETRWEAPPPGRPARHLYRLTQAGLDLAAAQTEAAPAQAAQPAATRPPRPSTPRPRALRPGPPEPQLDGT